MAYTIQWAARWPLVGVACAQDRLADAITHARAILGPLEQPLPDGLNALVEAAVQAWDADQPEAARAPRRSDAAGARDRLSVTYSVRPHHNADVDYSNAVNRRPSYRIDITVRMSGMRNAGSQYWLTIRLHAGPGIPRMVIFTFHDRGRRLTWTARKGQVACKA